MKINKIIEEISKKNRINSRKDREIKLLGAQLVKFKKYLKNGNLEKIQNEPDIEILGDEERSDMTGQNDGDTEMTEKTGFYDNNDNNINNVKLNKSKKESIGIGDEDINNDKLDDNEEGEEENNEHNQEEKNLTEENDGDDIVNKENNEVSHNGEEGENINPEEED